MYFVISNLRTVAIVDPSVGFKLTGKATVYIPSIYVHT